MRTLIIYFAFLTFATGLLAQSDESTYTLTMTVTDLDPVKGKIAIQLMDVEEKAIKQQWVAVEDDVITAVFNDLPAGRYAVQYYHDANDNDELDFAWYGAPSEGYGNSNNVKGFFGPPDFKEQLFELKGDIVVEMKTMN